MYFQLLSTKMTPVTTIHPASIKSRMNTSIPRWIPLLIDPFFCMSFFGYVCCLGFNEQRAHSTIRLSEHLKLLVLAIDPVHFPTIMTANTTSKINHQNFYPVRLKVPVYQKTKMKIFRKIRCWGWDSAALLTTKLHFLWASQHTNSAHYSERKMLVLTPRAGKQRFGAACKCAHWKNKNPYDEKNTNSICRESSAIHFQRIGILIAGGEIKLQNLCK